MAQSWKMDVCHLNEDEREYETNIRSHYCPPPQSFTLSPIGILMRWVDTEVENGQNPADLPNKIPNESMGEEYAKCVEKVNEIHTFVLTKFVTAQINEELATEAQQLLSRLVHWTMRMKRINMQVDTITDEQRNGHTQVEQTAGMTRMILVGAVSHLPSAAVPPQNVTNSTTSTSTSTNATGGTENDTRTPIDNGQNANTDIPQPLNSTVIGQPHGEQSFNPNATEFSSAADTPYDAVAEMRRRQETEAARHWAEFEICKGRVHDLHEDVRHEYRTMSSPRRPSEAKAMMDRLKIFEQVLNGIRHVTNDSALKTAVDHEMGLLLTDSYILNTNIMVEAQTQGSRTPRTDMPAALNQSNMPRTVGTAHSTVRPAVNQPSIPLFNRELDGMTFNVSHPFTVHDSQIAGGVDAVVQNAANSAHVNFVSNPAIISTHSQQANTADPLNIHHSHQSPPQQQQQQQVPSHPRPYQRQQQPYQPSQQPMQQQHLFQQQPHHIQPQQTSNLPYSHPTEPAPQRINSLVSSPWNPMGDLPTTNHLDHRTANNLRTFAPAQPTVGRIYHPAVSPVRYPEYSVEPLEHNNSQLLLDAQIGQLPSMNVCQGQQYLARVLGHRRYEGKVNDQSKNISLDEFIGHARAYQKSSGYSDTVLLTQLATFFSNQAFKWWQSNSASITTLDELETRLRSRFERKATGGLSTLGEFVGRKQGKTEELLDYMDEMRILSMACYPPLAAPQIITCIIDNSLDKYRNFLATRQYASISELILFAEYIVRVEPMAEIKSNSYTTRKPNYSQNYSSNYQPKSVYALGVESDSVENTHETTIEGSDAENSNTNAMIDAITREFNKWQSNWKSQQNQRAVNPVSSLANGQNTQFRQNRTDFACYGCNAPGIYRKDCPNCLLKEKNVKATL